MEIEEKIIRIPKMFGNGAHVFVPKNWIGEQVILVKQPKKDFKARIIQVLEPYLENILGAYLYGSYARTEQNEYSDIDLFIISNKKIIIKEKGFEIISLEEKNIENALKIEPLLIYLILSEAKPIINSKLLEELKNKYHPKLSDFNEFFRLTKEMIKVNLEFLNLEKGDYILGSAVIYSLVLRLRGIYFIRSLLKAEQHSNKSFKNWVRKELPRIDFNKIYDSYIFAKNDKKTNLKILVKDLRILMDFLKEQISILENDKKGKEA